MEASNRQIFNCHISAEEQLDLKTKTWKRKQSHLFFGLIFSKAFLRGTSFPDYSFPYFLRGSLYEFLDSAGQLQLSLSIAASWGMMILSGSLHRDFKA